MADWKELSNSRVVFKSNSGQVSGNIETYIEYDADRTTPTQTYIRFRGSAISGSATSWQDTFYVLYNPNNNPEGRTIKLIKTHYTQGGRWDEPGDSTGIKITKSYSSETFYVQDYWICNDGQFASGKYPSDMLLNADWAYTYFKDNRSNWIQTGLGSESHSIMKSDTVATAVTVSKPTITDNGDNTFTIKASAGKAGTNNKVNSSTLYYRKGTSGTYLKASGLTLSEEKITASAASASQTVYAYTEVDGQYNDPTSSTASASIKNYVAPNVPGKPVISYTKSRLTIKENWTYTWTAATQSNSSSPVKGYRIKIFKNGTEIPGLTCSTSNNTIGKGSGSTKYVDRESTSCTITFNPVTLGFEPKDTIKVRIHAYTKNAAGGKVFNSANTDSVESTVQNAGIVHVRVNNAWKEGQVYVKVSGAWKEAESVHTKVSGSWKEST